MPCDDRLSWPISMRHVKDHIQQRFGNVAANYRTSSVHSAGKDLDLMVHRADLTSATEVLDAGCGAGHASLAFAPHVARVIACDFTSAMLDQVNQLSQERGVHNIDTQLADVDSLPFSANCFDLVASRYSAHHWLQPEKALAEFRRVLKPHGALLISDIMAREDYAQDSFLQTIEVLRDPSHVRDFRISEWRAMLSAAGFSIEILLTFDLTLHFSTWTKRMATPGQNIQMIKALFNTAPDDIKRSFGLPEQMPDDDFDFVIPGAVIQGIPKAD